VVWQDDSQKIVIIIKMGGQIPQSALTLEDDPQQISSEGHWELFFQAQKLIEKMVLVALFKQNR
jgi:hypothetical protein